MHTVKDILPDQGINVLVFSLETKKWSIARVDKINNAQMWRTDYNLFRSIDYYTFWTDLPPNPA